MGRCTAYDTEARRRQVRGSEAFREGFPQANVRLSKPNLRRVSLCVNACRQSQGRTLFQSRFGIKI